MTWAEFRIRSYAYHRMQKTEWYKIRELAWASTVGPHLNPKKLSKSKEAFMPLNRESVGGKLSQKQIDRIIEVKKEYLRQKRELDG